MKTIRYFLPFLLILQSIGVWAQVQFNTGKLSVKGNLHNINGGTYTLSDSTYIGLKGPHFKSLLCIKGLTLSDTLAQGTIKVVGAFQLYAKVGNSSFQLLWNKSGSDTLILTEQVLLNDTGLYAPGGSSIIVQGATVQVSHVRLIEPSDTTLMNSYVAVQGKLILPETGSGIAYNLNGVQSVVIRDTLNYLPSLNVSTQANFAVKGFGYSSNQLNIRYNETTQQFALYGRVIYRIDSNDIPGLLGDSINPGMVFTNGSISYLQLTVTDTFRLFKQKFHPTLFTISLNTGDSSYKIYGSLGIEIKGSILRLSLGDSTNPGAIGNRNQLVKFNGSINDTFSLAGLRFKPNQLTFGYDTNSVNGRFYAFGEVTCSFARDSSASPDSLTVALGDANSPGLEIANGSLEQFAMAFTTSFTLKQLRITPQSAGFKMIPANNTFCMYGGLKLDVDSSSYSIQAGSVDNPGISINNGKLVRFEAMVNDTISVKSLRIKPNQLTFLYDTTQGSSFALFGSATLFLKSDSANQQDTMTVLLGTPNAPGIHIRNGKLIQLNMGVSGHFNMKQLSVQPDSLTITYNRDSSRYELFGRASFALNQDTLQVDLGDVNAPGVVIQNNELVRLQAGITDTFTIKTLKVIPQGLTFRYVQGQSYAMFGNLNMIIDTDTIQGILGNSEQPGLSFANGSLQQINIGIIKTAFNLKRIRFQTDSLVFRYQTAKNRYELFGDVNISFDSNTCAVGLGNEQKPGLVFANGSLQQLNISVTDTFQLKGVVFEPKELTFQYDRTSNEYELFGAATTIVQQDTIQIQLGTDSMPGIRIRDGKLNDFAIGITTDFKLKSLEFKPKQLTFFYSSISNRIGIYGDLSIRFDSNTLNMNLGTSSNPGWVFNSRNGNVDHINMTTSDTFHLYGLMIRPNRLNFSYDRALNRYSMYGSVLMALRNDSVEISLGDSAMPGFIYQNGALQQLIMGVTDSLTLFQLRMKSKGLTVAYMPNMKQFSMYGTAAIGFSNQLMEVGLGNAAQPGIVIRNSEVQSLNFSVNAAFQIGGMKFNAKQASFVYDRQNNFYKMFGSVGFVLENDSVFANLGTAEYPGFTIRNGELYEMNIGITSNISIGGLRVNTQDVGMYYEKRQNESIYVIRGTVSVQELWSISTTLGVPGDPTRGLEIIVDHNGKARVDVTDFVIEAKHVNFGGVTFNDIRVRYNKLNNGFSVGGELDVVFPPGFEVGGKLAFTEQNGKFFLDTIALKYDAGNSEGIEIGNTGVFLTHIEGEVDRVPGTSNDYKFSGDVVVIAGGKINIANTSYAMLRIEGKAQADKNHLFLDNDIQVAAYNINNKWEGLYGSGEVTVDLNWSRGEYTVTGALTYYSMVHFKTEAYYHTNGTMGAMGEVDLVVPDFIPIIGGTTLAGIDGAVRYAKNDLNNSKAAGWTTVNLEVKTVTIGAEYNFGTKKIRKIGASDVAGLQTSISSDNNATQRVDFFMLQPHTKAVTLKIKLLDPSLTGRFISLLNLGAITRQTSMQLWTPQPGQQGMIDIGKHLWGGEYNIGKPFQSPDYTFYYDSVNINGIVIHFTGLALNENEALPPGQYTLITKMPVDVPPYTIEVQSHYMSPIAEVQGIYNQQTRQVDIRYNATVYINDTAKVHVYETDTPAYIGKYIGSKVLATDGKAGQQRFTGQFTYTPHIDSAIVEGDTLNRPLRKEPLIKSKKIYVYTIVEDGVNEPIYSDLYKVDIQPRTTLTLDVVDRKMLPKSGSFVGAEVSFDIDIAYANYKDIEGFRFTVYYDLDNQGYNGFAIPGLSDLSLASLEQQDSLLKYVIENLNIFGNSAALYFYVVGKGPRTGAVLSSYTYQVSFNAPFMIRTQYNQNGTKRDIQNIGVWVDINQNARYDAGSDLLKYTDHHGEVAFYIGAGTYTIGVMADSILQEVNAQSELTRTITWAGDKPFNLSFQLTPPPFTITVNYQFEDKKQQNVLWALNGTGTQRNYFFVDLNNNALWDNNEPKSFLDQSGSCNFSVQAAHATLYFVDQLSKSTSLTDKDRLKLSCSKAKASVGNASATVNRKDRSFYWTVDSRDADGSNHLNTSFLGVLENF